MTRKNREWYRTLKRTQIGMFRPIRMDHTNCLQVAIKTLQSILQYLSRVQEFL
jgi:hypothetical protein